MRKNTSTAALCHAPRREVTGGRGAHFVLGGGRRQCESCAAMRGSLWVVLALSATACTMQSFEYDATVVFSPSLGTVRLNHQPVAPGAVWAASYASYRDAVRNPSVVEIDDAAGVRTIAIGPEVCASVCADCSFDRATLAFVIDGDRVSVSGTCGDGEREHAIP